VGSRVCFISSRPAFVVSDNTFRMDWANARLIEFLSQRLNSSFSVSVFSDPADNEKYNHKVTVNHVYPFPFPFTQIAGVTNFMKIRSMLRTIEAQNDFLIVQLPIIGFPLLLLLKKPLLFHVCANVLTAANNPVKYQGVHGLVARLAAKFIYHTNRKLFSHKNASLIVNGHELGRLYKEFDPTVVISSSLLKNDVLETVSDTLPATPFRIIFIGRPSLEKGFDVLIDALMTLPVDFRLTVIGFSRDEFSKLLPEYFEKSAPLHPRMDFKGYMNWSNEFKALLITHHTLVVPSRSEGTPRVILEGMSQGIPAVGSDVGGIPDIIQDGVTGFLFSQNSADELGKAILKLANDESLRRQMAMACLAFASKNTVEEFGSKFISNLPGSSK
jgi:glycosyltransferase involved in cell wall biosynthesis